MDKAVRGFVRPVFDGVIKYSGADRRGAAALTASAIRSVSLATAAGFLPSLKRYDQYAALPSVVANTVVIGGGADKTTPAEHARDIVAAIPDATHLHRPGAGHMLLGEHPRCVSTAVDRVLAIPAVSDRGLAS
ncbi:Lysophospholipase, alpha-beta hydrolase superfamily [Mycobacterium terramassiliense]|uniref:Lysophospholipase, alpha-beta hydrolase superfamily n=2 Tax=Mycobacterium terramassiliense TaxID=1841859 RepID=A0A2U3N683_9MYCO|nr:Lysophospholipase, alpha-beta hydrolase superfamily [Mycobacterium terramassiliense]